MKPTVREKRKRGSIPRETVLKDDNLKQGARTIEEKRVNGGVGVRLSLFLLLDKIAATARCVALEVLPKKCISTRMAPFYK